MREPEHWSQRARGCWNVQAYAGGGGAVECVNPRMKGSRNMWRGHTPHGGEAAAWRSSSREKTVASNVCLKE